MSSRSQTGKGLPSLRRVYELLPREHAKSVFALDNEYVVSGLTASNSAADSIGTYRSIISSREASLGSSCRRNSDQPTSWMARDRRRFCPFLSRSSPQQRSPRDLC